MKVEFVAGGASLEEMNRELKLFTDGKRLALVSPYDTYLLDAYAITDFCVETDYHTSPYLTDAWVNPRLGGEMIGIHEMTSRRLQFTVRSMGRFGTCSDETISKMFLDANQMSVDDLLTLAYQKLNSDKED